MSNELYAVILAAGEGKRMKSSKSKVLHKILGKEMIRYGIEAAAEAGVKESCIIIGNKAEQIKEALGEGYTYAYQYEQKGTGHAVKMADEFLKDKRGNTIVLCGDVPLITADTLKGLVEEHEENNNAATIITADFDDPKGYGRIVRNEDGSFCKIVEDRDCNEYEKKIRECNSGIYIFKTEELIKGLLNLNNNNDQKEYYLTDVPANIKDSGMKVGLFKIEDSRETLGVNDRIQLAQVSEIMKDKIIEKHMREGVTFVDPKSCFVSKDVKIGMDTVVYPNCILEGDTVIGEECIIGPNSRIVSANICNYAEINNSVILESTIGEKTKVGPFAYVRPGNSVGSNVKVGDFVELKKSVIGDGTKISHLTYVGDSEIGRNVNLGCGVVTVNYDGKNKFKTKVGDNSFVGCNVNLVAPVEVADNTFIAAGSTITDYVPEQALAIARQRQTNIDGWVKRAGKERGK